MKLRRLTAGELRLAADVFGDGLSTERLWMLTGAPTGRFAMVLFWLMLFPSHTADFAAEPVAYQAWFIHELTHAWQFQTRPLWTLWSWACVALSGGYLDHRAYRYGVPIVWSRLNLEQQAKVVEHGFALRSGVRSADMPSSVDAADYPDLKRVQRKSRRYATSGPSAGGMG